jgi:predicted NBD/HSP70 family sugar kinase
MKESEFRHLLKVIYYQRPISRTALSEQLGLSLGYVSLLVKRLQEDGFLVEGGFADSSGGRRRIHLQFNPELAHLVGVDFGTANIRIVVTDLLGKVLQFERFPSATSKGRDSSLHMVCDQVNEYCRKDGLIRAIGIAHSGVIDHDEGTVLFWPKVQGWEKVPVRAILEQLCGKPALVEDSSRTMALAEQQFGEGKGIKDLVHVSLGMGIGSAVFANGQLCLGHRGLAGELGHITIDEYGELCSYGNRGCLEVFASGSAIIEKVRSALRQGVISSLATRDDGALTIESIVSAGRAGDRLSHNVVSEAGTHLGTALADLVNLLNSQRIILGGAVPQVAQSLLMEPLMVSLRQRAFSHSVHDLGVVVSRLGEEAAAVGAALRIAERVLEEELRRKLDR